MKKILVLVLLVLVGCSGTTNPIVGRWENISDNGCKETLIFNKDMTFKNISNKAVMSGKYSLIQDGNSSVLSVLVTEDNEKPDCDGICRQQKNYWSMDVNISGGELSFSGASYERIN